MANPFANTVKFLKAVNQLASPQGATIKRLMEDLCISRRSVFRLLEALEELGIPLIEEQPQPRVEKTYRVFDSYVLKLPNMTFLNPELTVTEMDRLLAALDYCKQFDQFEKTLELQAIREKIMAIRPKENNYERGRRRI